MSFMSLGVWEFGSFMSLGVREFYEFGSFCTLKTTPCKLLTLFSAIKDGVNGGDNQQGQ